MKQVHLIVLYRIIYLKQFQFYAFFICQINALPTYSSLLFNIYFFSTNKNGVYLTVKVNRGNKNMDFLIRHLCLESPSFDAVEFRLRGA